MKTNKVIFSILCLPLLLAGTGVPVKTPEDSVPMAIARRVADKVIRDARFHYNLTIAGKDQYGPVQTVDFSRNFTTEGLAYALSSVVSESDKVVDLQVGHTGDLKIRVNGGEAYQSPGQADKALTFVERDLALGKTIQVKLKAGLNTILFKSKSPDSGPWRVYLRPEKFEFSLQQFPKLNEKVANFTNFLILGTFPASHYDTGLEPETEFNPGKLYNYGGQPTTWTIPRPELVAENAEIHQPWGEGYTAFNYHAGGVAWAIGSLGDYLNDEKYQAYIKNYCDFYIEKRPYLAWQKHNLNAFNAYDNRVVESLLLDFTTSPLLPYTHLLLQDKEQKNTAY